MNSNSRVLFVIFILCLVVGCDQPLNPVSPGDRDSAVKLELKEPVKKAPARDSACVIWLQDSTTVVMFQGDTMNFKSEDELDWMFDHYDRAALKDKIIIEADSIVAVGRVKAIMRWSSDNDLGSTIMQIDPER